MSTDLTAQLTNVTTQQGLTEIINQIPEDQFITTVERMISNTNSPTKYLVQRLLKQYKQLQEIHSKSNDDAPTSKKDVDYQQKMIEVYERYGYLETLYKEEHTHVLNLSDEKSQLQVELEAKNKRLQEAEKKIHELESSPQPGNLEEATRKIRELESAIQTQRERYKDITTKQGIGRKRLEDLLVAKDNELSVALSKVKDIEAEYAQLKTTSDSYGVLFSAIAQQHPQVLQQYLQRPTTTTTATTTATTQPQT